MVVERLLGALVKGPLAGVIYKAGAGGDLEVQAGL